MRPIEQETNIEVLRQYTLMFRDEVQRFKDRFAALEEVLRSQDQEFLALELKDQLNKLQKKFFGFGRELNPGKAPRAVGHENAQLKLHSNRSIEEKESSKEENPEHEPIANLYQMLEKELDEESKIRELSVGSKAWKEINGLYQESTEITVTERVYQKVIHRQAKYRLKEEYNNTGKEVIITAKGPAKLKAGSQYSIDFATSVASDKYEYHLPLERQRRKMSEAGLEVEVKTLYNMCETVAEHCNPILQKIIDEIQSDFCAVHMDESPWKILGTKQSGYMWVMSNRKGCYYQFEPSRSGKIPKEMLKSYKGAIVTDAYGGYNTVRADPDIRVAHCWAHARREFYERYDDYPDECGFALAFIDKLFEIEGRAKDFDGLRTLRSTESKATIDALKVGLQEIRSRYLNAEGISKAVAYCLNHWAELTLFLQDLSVPLSNNDAERALRHAVLGRKNFAGSKTINGADTAAALYTVIETCKRNSVHPKDYFKYVITERWHDREPLTPLKYALTKFKENTKIKWPEKDQWRIL